jgi:hypothetical protein
VVKVLRFTAKKMIAVTTERKKTMLKMLKKDGFFSHFAISSLAL